MKKAVLLSNNDSVATVIESVHMGDIVEFTCCWKDVSVIAANEINIYHKIAVQAIPCGAPVVKYGEIIGRALADISVGEHVHTHNLG